MEISSAFIKPSFGRCIKKWKEKKEIYACTIVSLIQHLRQVGVVGKFVEFYGPGVAHLSIADRATISNMCPEYGATVGYFPVDDASLGYLRQTGELVKEE